MEYYKILKKSMKRYGMKYKKGLNVDICDFDVSSICGGGLFFTDAKHILGFLDYGTLIAKVTLPENEPIVKVDDKWKAHSIILSDIREINLDIIKELIKQGADIRTDNNYAIRWAAENGHLDVIKYLVEQGADIHANHDRSVRWAALNGHLDVVKYLVEQGADIHTDNDYAIRWAAKAGLTLLKI